MYLKLLDVVDVVLFLEEEEVAECRMVEASLTRDAPSWLTRILARLRVPSAFKLFVQN
jgi:hypothetical protein